MHFAGGGMKQAPYGSPGCNCIGEARVHLAFHTQILSLLQ